MQREYKTKSKDYILEYIKKNKQRRFSVADIQEYLLSKDININLTTIYRNIDKLLENDTLLKFKNNKEDFCVYQYHEPGANCNNHLHIQCNKCGKIFHLDDDFMIKLKKYLNTDCGFYIDCENSILQGLCENCYTNNN